ncbi:hypothetical protein [Actinoplanes regularis]|uniref:Uncharacterized protein n=1 Tax=Actinoplanes regularis TaxID=52697 RepID=A0A239DRL8_9ACTN|nr:hypothetical protein [Actinoplanes regularis]GIE89051.1 hypothetical protein Are01nite_55310 [Actinoplanes regularis]SNS34761.1 hypothetical protein SAMN06264365_11452 [Actinoplanes regularis]
MDIAEDTLWKTGNLGRDWRRWARWLISIAVIGGSGLLVICFDRPILGSSLTGLAVLLLVIAVALWVYDYTSVVEARMVDDPEPVIWIRTVSGREERFTPDSMVTVTLVCTPFASGPDTSNEERAFFNQQYQKAVLRLRTRDGRRLHGRTAPYVSVAEMDQVMAAWLRVCPQAHQYREYRPVGTGTGD